MQTSTTKTKNLKKKNALLLVSFSRVLIATQEFNLGDLKCSMHLHKSTLQGIVA